MSRTGGQVALRKESVDRNLWWGVRKAVGSLSLSARRAWIEMPRNHRFRRWPVSLSARRAWIEITYVILLPRIQVVALRKESVDRNYPARSKKIGRLLSLSARRAWIEISRAASFQHRSHQVALRKESVDRN